MQMGSLGNENRDLQRGSPGNPGKAGEGSAEKEHECSPLTRAKPVPLPLGTHVDTRRKPPATDPGFSPIVVRFPQKQTLS